MNNSQQNIFHLKRLQEKEHNKTRLSRFPDSMPSPPELFKAHPDSLATMPPALAQEQYQADVNVPRGRTVGITTPHGDETDHGIHLDTMLSRQGRQYEPSFTNFSMYMPGHMLADAFKVLHHLSKGHSSLFEGEGRAVADDRQSRSKPAIDRYPSMNEEDRPFSVIRTPTRFRSNEDLIEHMPKLFTSLLLTHLNDRNNRFIHPGQDELEDLGKLKRGEESETDIPEDDESITSRLHENTLEKHDSIIREYAPILKDYVRHVLEERSPSDLHSFIGSHKSRNFGILTMLQDVLKGE